MFPVEPDLRLLEQQLGEPIPHTQRENGTGELSICTVGKESFRHGTDHHAARLAAALELPFLAIGLWERAFAGEIFYSHPGEPMPCYSCTFAGLGETFGARPEPARRFHSNETELGGERAEIFAHPLQVTRSIQVRYGEHCPPCRWRR
ncbi:hypothetical protein C7B81_02015 [Aphanothece cf. minutissima CCALA 015]|uniref:Uncharacterized protein n=1 Tax=Aphanothece cf. minutissima CCALA 015 TaxID=2107695 RepID=A0ABX5FC78_9CHRO|nr:hypothetical protein C7B81_02015 [Aphanothece cf. minutissima CCALA 015]